MDIYVHWPAEFFTSERADNPPRTFLLTHFRDGTDLLTAFKFKNDMYCLELSTRQYVQNHLIMPPTFDRSPFVSNGVL